MFFDDADVFLRKLQLRHDTRHITWAIKRSLQLPVLSASTSAFIILISLSLSGNFYGTPKPPAEPSPFQPDPVDQVLFDNDFDTESQRKRTTSVSKMQRMDSSLPEEEEEEEKEAVNGSGGIGWLQREKFPEVFHE